MAWEEGDRAKGNTQCGENTVQLPGVHQKRITRGVVWDMTRWLLSRQPGVKTLPLAGCNDEIYESFLCGPPNTKWCLTLLGTQHLLVWQQAQNSIIQRLIITGNDTSQIHNTNISLVSTILHHSSLERIYYTAGNHSYTSSNFLHEHLLSKTSWLHRPTQNEQQHQHNQIPCCAIIATTTTIHLLNIIFVRSY